MKNAMINVVLFILWYFAIIVTISESSCSAGSRRDNGATRADVGSPVACTLAR